MQRMFTAYMMFALLGLGECLKGSSGNSAPYIDAIQIEVFGQSGSNTVRKREEPFEKLILSKEDLEGALEKWRKAYDQEKQRNKIGY